MIDSTDFPETKHRFPVCFTLMFDHIYVLKETQFMISLIFPFCVSLWGEDCPKASTSTTE